MMMNSELRWLLGDKEYDELGEFGQICRGLDLAGVPYDVFTSGKPDAKSFPALFEYGSADFTVERLSIVFPPLDGYYDTVPKFDFNTRLEFTAATVEEESNIRHIWKNP